MRRPVHNPDAGLRHSHHIPITTDAQRCLKLRIAVSGSQGENVWDVITLFSLSLWVCYSVLRTGTLWLAVGYHAAFDFMQLLVIGTRNGSITPADHLLNATFQGPAWVTGGVLGTEASFLMYPSIALIFPYLWVRFRRKPLNGAAEAAPFQK